MPNPTDPRAVADDPSGIVQQMPGGGDQALAEIVKRLRGQDPIPSRNEVADAIVKAEADLRAEVERLTYEVKRLREALYDVCFEYDPSDTCQNAMVMRDIARAALSPETDGGRDG